MNEAFDIRHDVVLAPLTTIGLGGRARYFAECDTATEARECLSFAERRRVPLQILGGGSNIIFQDEGYRGLVLKVGLRGVLFTRSGNTITATVGAGEPWDGFVEACVMRGYAGLECLSGIPGSVGGTPIQNVGAYGQEVAETIETVTALDRLTKTEVTFSNAECGFGYRQSRFKSADADRFIVTEISFKLQADGEPAVRYPELQRYIQGSGTTDASSPDLLRVREAVLALRRKKSMLADPSDPYARSVGSFFTNPVISSEAFEEVRSKWGHPGEIIPSFPSGTMVKIPAAWLVEHAGFARGYRREGVGISAHHALALVNLGGTAHDILLLAHDIQAAVFETFGITLEREPIVVGRNKNDR